MRISSSARKNVLISIRDSIISSTTFLQGEFCAILAVLYNIFFNKNFILAVGLTRFIQHTK